MKVSSNPGHPVILWLTDTDNCVSYNFFKMSFPWALWFPSCKILSLSHFCSGCWGSLGGFYESIDFAAHGVPQECWGDTCRLFLIPVKVFGNTSCGGISIGWYCGGFQNGSFSWENERKRLKEQSYRNSLPAFMLGGLCRVGGASILIFLNIKDNNLKCGVIFRHYLEVWTCKTQLLDALKRTDTNEGQSTI